VEISVATDNGTHRVTGTVLGEYGPRIVELDGYPIDTPIQGILIYTRHEDRPGMIGRIGTLLGDRDINIAGMQVGRRETGGEAVMLLSVDKSVPQDVIDEIAKHPGIRLVRSIEL